MEIVWLEVLVNPGSYTILVTCLNLVRLINVETKSKILSVRALSYFFDKFSDVDFSDMNNWKVTKKLDGSEEFCSWLLFDCWCFFVAAIFETRFFP